MPFYKGMVQFITFEGRLSHSGDLLDMRFEAPNTDAAMEYMLDTRTPFVQRRAVNVQVTKIRMTEAYYLDRHSIYEPGVTRELAPGLTAIPRVVPRSAEELGKIIPVGEDVVYQNHQWLVTNAGLYSADGDHVVFIDKSELGALTEREDEPLYQWPVDLVRNTWVDAYAFCAAFEAAFAHHDPEAFDRRVYRNSVYAARADSAEFAFKQKASSRDFPSSMAMG